MTKLPTRAMLSQKETWDLTHLYPSQTAYEEAVKDIKNKIIAFKESYAGKLKDFATISKSLREFEEITQQFSYIGNYGSLGYEVDKFNEDYENNVVRLGAFGEWSGEALSFYESELALLPEETLTEVMASEEGKAYRYYLLEVMRRKERMLSPEIEATLSALDGSIHDNYDLYNAMKFQDMFFEEFEVDGQVYSNSFAGFEQDYEGHWNQAVRHSAWQSFHQGLGRYQNAAATNYINHVQTEKKIATLRGFDSVIAYLLFEQKVSQDSYHLIIDTLMSEFAPVMRRYAKMLKDEHGLATISLADIKMAFSTERAATITIEESREMAENALSVLGDDYSAIVNQAFDDRWIDYPMNETKSTGGFCASVYNGPSYILLNWSGLLSEVLVLAHELGHAGHFQLAYQEQLAITPSASMYFVEAPSTANEVITCQYLLNQPIEAAAKRSLLAEFIARTYYHNMVTHLIEADFQRKVYQAIDKEEVLNARKLNAFFKESLEDFWGDAVEINEGAELTWMRQPHYFMGLYPYTYSAGLTVGTQIGQRIAAGDQAAKDAWLNVLKAGGTKGPVELAAMADVDMKDEQALRDAIDYVSSLLDQIELLK